jgi:hypothetical protein
MRITLLATTLVVLIGCATTKPLTPREYLDEQTAATITVVADPVVFVHDREIASARGRDFLSLYGIDVNRMGEHRQYIAVLQWAPPEEVSAAAAIPALELRINEEPMVLQPTKASPRELGIAQPLAESYSYNATWWYFPVDKSVLRTLAEARDIGAAMVLPQRRIQYVMMNDGRAQLGELTAVLP